MNNKNTKKDFDKDDILTYYNIDDIKKIFRLDSKQKAYKLVKTQGFPSIKIGRDIRVNKKALIDFIEKNALNNKDFIL